MSLITIAKSIQSFLREEKTPMTIEGVYKTLMSNKNLFFIRDQVIKKEDLIPFIFICYLVSRGEVTEETVKYIKNNLYAYTIFEFGQITDLIECVNCEGNGNVLCDDCGGRGYINCDICDGAGEIDCDYCEGSGKLDDEECPYCNGEGTEECQTCNGAGETGCDNCYNGNVDCDVCDGRGEERVDDRLPYEINVYVSYNLDFKNILEKYSNDMINIDDFEADNSSLLLEIIDISASDEGTETIDLNLANKMYVGEILEDINFNIGTRINLNRIDSLPEKFEY